MGQLPVFVCKFRQHSQLEVGSVSLIRDEGVPQVDVAAAVITELYTGSDGVRTAELRTAKGMQEAGCTACP